MKDVFGTAAEEGIVEVSGKDAWHLVQGGGGGIAERSGAGRASLNPSGGGSASST